MRQRWYRIVLAAVIWTALVVLPAHTQQLSEPVLTEYGPVRGEVLSNSIRFRGIPYAAPPIGPLRWRAPQPPQPWAELRATAYGSPCPQFAADGGFLGSEDCLTLNIWTPKNRGASLRPVMVFIHGGANTFGASSLPTYDGQAFAEKGGVVLVTINYRLGQFGYLAHPLLSAEDTVHQSSGNYGLLDQIFALQWVQRNIANFGGDPTNVTIFGESAGGLNVACLLASPAAAGLFHRAIIQSGGFFVSKPLRDDDPQTESAEEFGQRFEQEINCSSANDPLACMRRKTTREVIDTLRPPPPVVGGCRNPPCPEYGPNVDGYVLTGSPVELMRQGQYNNVPTIVGTNKNEASIFITLVFPLVTEAQYQAAVRRYLPAVADQVLARYPISDYRNARDALDAVFTDLLFICPARLGTRAMSMHQSNIYVYHFTHGLESRLYNYLGAFHALELYFVFNNFVLPAHTPTNRELDLANTMLRYWTNFARSGDPNGQGLPRWPVYTLDGDRHIILDERISTGTQLRKEFCEFWCDVLGLSCF